MVEAVRTSIFVAALVAFASIVSYGIAYYSWKYADHPVSSRFALVLAADGAWAMFEFFQMISPTDAIATAWLLPESTVSTLAAALWFLFVIEYTGDSDWIPGIVERIVEAHGWEVRVTESETGGARFEITDITPLDRRDRQKVSTQ